MQRALAYTPGNVGLANRLRALLGYHALCRCLGIDFYLCWQPVRACDVAFSALFVESPGLHAMTAEDGQRAARARRGAVCFLSPWFDQIWLRHGSGLVSRRRFYAEVKRCLRDLKPRPELRERAECFAREQRLDRCIALHVRGTDLLLRRRGAIAAGSSADPDKRSEIEGFIRLIEERPTARFFLATDNSAIERRLQRRFGARIVAYPKRYRLSFSQWRKRAGRPGYPLCTRTSGMEDALIEMLLLGRCRRLVGTYFSSFSKFAAMWGGIACAEIQGERCVPVAPPLPLRRKRRHVRGTSGATGRNGSVPRAVARRS